MPLTGVAGLAVDAALGVWLGKIAFFSFVVAPRAFAVLDEDDAAALVNDVFPRYYLVGMALGAVAAAAALVCAPGRTGVVVAVAAAVGVAANAYARFVLVPRIRAAEGDAFQRYHGRSVALNLVTLVAVAVGLGAAALL
ncbi:MAG: DUF4149 domain-containing protein [Halobacteriaceae archaeon]